MIVCFQQLLVQSLGPLYLFAGFTTREGEEISRKERRGFLPIINILDEELPPI